MWYAVLLVFLLALDTFPQKSLAFWLPGRLPGGKMELFSRGSAKSKTLKLWTFELKCILLRVGTIPDIIFKEIHINFGPWMVKYIPFLNLSAEGLMAFTDGSCFFYPRPLGPKGIVIAQAVCLSVCLSVRLSVRMGFPGNSVKAFLRFTFQFLVHIINIKGKNWLDFPGDPLSFRPLAAKKLVKMACVGGFRTTPSKVTNQFS